ncbi:phosphatase PAP2 family protein [Paraburkholderia unamae]|uniref:Undecaprenyl-diphosphatase n=1 Tax=Paraburkholderia unamae TaxID=219649 RepID=A0ABX5KSG9_9BURK|nr:phosphatase PAP2 family protein [Paraburkholderia unamae]PVX85578.1 undecaprenyl-diphosphatase [Paraburkholderia unamae]RAR56482.1 undecaprenyl-diphosphatase [Paraburkholderia unamae]
MKPLSAFFCKLLRRFSDMEPGAVVGGEEGWRFVLRRTGFAKLAVAVMLVLGGIWLFLGILEDILSGDPLVAVDRMLHKGLHGLRTPLVDHVMVAASELGDAAVTIPVFLAVLSVLLVRREWRTAGYWIVAIAMAEASVKLIKFAVQRSRPVSIYEGIESFSFPSGHATLSIVIYGFLTYLVCRGHQKRAQFRIAVISGSVIALISISRLYLGVHWLSDILAGLSLGTAWIVFLSVAHHLRDRDTRGSPVLLVVALVTLLTTAVVHISLHHSADLVRYVM